MKKRRIITLLGIFSFVICFFFFSGGKVLAYDGIKIDIQRVQPGVTIDPFPDFEPTPITDISIASDTPVNKMKSFDNVDHAKFGTIHLDSTAYDMKRVKASEKTSNSEEKTYKDIVDVRYDTYYFGKLIDVPVKNLYSRRVSVGECVSITLQTTSIKEEEASATSSASTNFYWEYCNELKYSMGVSLELQNIGYKESVDTNLTEEIVIKVGGNLFSTISHTISSTTSYSTIYTETFTFDNTNSTRAIYYDLNYRHKFKAYFTTKYQYNYEETSKQGGEYTYWDYKVKNYTPIDTYIYLIPIEIPYFEVSKYYDNIDGLKTIIKPDGSPNIFYL